MVKNEETTNLAGNFGMKMEVVKDSDGLTKIYIPKGKTVCSYTVK